MKPLRYLDICSGYSACTIGWQGLPFECVGYAEIDPAPAAVLSHRYGAGRPRAMPDPAAVIFPPGLDPLDKPLFEAAKDRKKHKTASEIDLAFIDAWKDRAQRAANIRALDFIKWGDRLPNFGDFTTIGEQDVGAIDLLIGGTPCQAFSIAGTLRGRAGGGGWPDGCDAANGHLVAHTLRGEGHDAMDDGTGKGTPLVTVPAVAPTLDAAGGDSGGGGTRPQMLVPAVAPTLRAGGNQTGGDRPPGTDVDTADSLVPVMVSGCHGSNGAGIGEPGDPAFALDTKGAQGVAVPIHVPEICPQSVSSKWAKGSSGPAGDEIANLVAFTVKDHGQDASAEVSPTLRAMEHAGSHANGGGQVAIAFPANMSSTQCATERDVSPALQSRNPTAIAFDTTQITSPANRSNPEPGDPCHTLPQSGHAPSVAMIGHNSGAYRVRRLTPRECERLQAAPDDFTLVPYLRGKLMADGPRYKMIGNSQSANKLRWIGRGIAEVEAELIKAGKA